MLATVEVKGTSSAGHLVPHFIDAEQPMVVVDKKQGDYRSVVILGNNYMITAVETADNILDMVAAGRRKAAQFRQEFMLSLEED